MFFLFRMIIKNGLLMFINGNNYGIIKTMLTFAMSTITIVVQEFFDLLTNNRVAVTGGFSEVYKYT